jgi:hypothetical protein
MTDQNKEIKLEQIADGLYVGESTRAIAIKPEEIAFGRYVLPNTLGHGEYEDIGARLVEASREQGQWVGMAFYTLIDKLLAEMNDTIDDNNKRRAKLNNPRKGLLETVCDRAKYLIGGKKAVAEPAQTETEEQPQRPYSLLVFQMHAYGPSGAEILRSEVRGMIDKGYLDYVKLEDKEILLPTQKFAETVYRAQKN